MNLALRATERLREGVGKVGTPGQGRTGQSDEELAETAASQRRSHQGFRGEQPGSLAASRDPKIHRMIRQGRVRQAADQDAMEAWAAGGFSSGVFSDTEPQDMGSAWDEVEEL
jgi:hypothetical protein